MEPTSIKSRIYFSTIALLGALIFAVIFIITRPNQPVLERNDIAGTTSPTAKTYVSNNSTYTVLGLIHTIPWDKSCDGLNHGKKFDTIVEITYPQIQGLKNSNLEQSINLFLEQELLTDPIQRAKVTCGLPEDPEYFGETGMNTEFDIKLQNDSYLSFKNTETTALLSNLRPSIEYRGYTIDMTDGSVLGYKDLFKTDAESRQAMKQQILAGLPKEVREIPAANDGDVLDYDFYITQDSVIFFNIFLSAAFQGIDVKLPFSKLQDLMVTKIN